MEQRLDLVSNDAGELVRREKARELGADVVVAIYRLLRLARMHDLSNKAFVSQLEQTHALVGEYGLRSDGNVNILFAERAVFVAGQLLKGSRQVYEAATELGQMLDWCGGAELTVQRDVTAAELKDFAEAIAQGLRVEKAAAFRSASTKIRLRPVNDAARLRGLDVEDLTEEQRIVRTYATAVVIMRRLFEDLAAGRMVLPRRVKRIAQKLVDLSEGGKPAYLGITEMRNANHDDAGRAVNGAILAVSMARQLTEDRTLLAQIAMAAMLHDVARPAAISRASGGNPDAIQAFLTDEAEDEVAAGTAAVLTALGRLNEATITRTVIAFESQWLRRAQSLGPTYHGVRGPTLQARMIAVARRYNDLLIPEPGMPAPPPDYAIATLWKELPDPADRTVVRLLASALRLFPVGTVVGLSTGEIAAVVPGGRRDAGSARPKVRIVMDADGAPLDRAMDVDLAEAAADAPGRAIVKVLSTEGWAKGLSLRPRADGEEEPEPEPMPWERDGVKPPSVSRIIAAPVAEPGGPSGKPAGATPPHGTKSPPAGASGKRRPTQALGSGAPSFDAARGEAPPARAPLAPAFDAAPAAPAARAPLAPAFEPPPAGSARERATPPPASERVTPSSRRVVIEAPPGGPPAGGRERATPPPASERVTPSSRRIVLGAKAAASGPSPAPTPSPPSRPAAPPSAAPPPARAATPSPPVARPVRPGKLPPGATPTPSAPSRVAPPAAAPPAPKGTPSPPSRPVAKSGAGQGEEPVRWGRRLEDFSPGPGTPPPPAAPPAPFDARTRVAQSTTTAAKQSEAVRLVPSDLVPAAHGTLGVTPLAHILVYMVDNRATGSVSFHEPDGWEHIVAVYEGAPALVKTERPVALLGNELVAKGVITREIMLRAVEEARHVGALIGEHLVDKGLISTEDLTDALQKQVTHKVSGLANLPEGTRYAYYPGRNFLEDWAAGELYPAEPLSTILDSVRGWMDRVRIIGTLSRVGAQPLILQNEANLGFLELTPEEQIVLDVIRSEGLPLAHLFDRQVADVEVVRSLVYMLAITRQFEFSRERGAPMQGGRPVMPPRPTRRRASGALRVTVPDPRVEERLEPPGEIPPAITPLPRSRDTEPQPAPDSADLSAAAEAGADDAGWGDAAADAADALLEGAEDLDVEVDLDSEEFEEAEPSAVSAGPLSEDPAERLLQAMNDFRLAQDALQKGDIAESEAFAIRAVEGDPGNGDHIALLAWIRAKDGDADRVEESLFQLSQVLEEEPGLLRARLYRGRLNKRTERYLEALRDFEAVLEVNPRHREAASEVKFLRLRFKDQ